MIGAVISLVRNVCLSRLASGLLLFFMASQTGKNCFGVVVWCVRAECGQNGPSQLNIGSEIYFSTSSLFTFTIHFLSRLMQCLEPIFSSLGPIEN